jgi:glycosyltransferase involved in cell wall biosynthesis
VNVLHVIPAVAKRYGGPSTAVIDMCRAQQAQGVDVTIACTDADGDERLDVPIGMPIPHHGVQTIFFPRLASEAFKYSPSLASWLSAHAGNFDVVHIHAVMSHACLAATQACRAAAVPYVLRTLGTLDEWSLAQKSFKKRVFMELWGRTMLSGAAAVHATSTEEQSSLRSRWKVERAIVIPLGIPDGAFAGGRAEPDAPPYVATMSRMHPVKGLDLLIDAFVRATAEPPLHAWRLVIAGDGAPADVAALTARARTSPAAARITFPGWVDGERKVSLLRGAALHALTSHHENFGMAVTEALAAGVPCLVSRAVHLAPWIEDARAGWLTALDRPAIEATLREAMADPDERCRRGLAARQLAGRWRWSAIAQEMVALYRTVHRDAVRAGRARAVTPRRTRQVALSGARRAGPAS